MKVTSASLLLTPVLAFLWGRDEFAYRRLCAITSPQHRASPAMPDYLNDATVPFSVNGSSLPYVDFDIGESYAGLLPIGDSGDDYFFWFVPSAEQLTSLLHANGPVTWQAGTHAPVSNTWAWPNLTNVVWVDQPTGTGYSNGPPAVRSEEDVARRFVAWWRNFVDLFQLHHAKIFMAGESYAGQFIPYIADAMMYENDERYFNVSGILLYEPGIGDNVVQFQVPMASFVEAHRQSLCLNDSFRQHIQDVSQVYGFEDYVSNHLQYPPSMPQPSNLTRAESISVDCNIFEPIFHAFRLVNPCFNIYQIFQRCPIPFDPLGFPYSNYYLPPTFSTPYFNLSSVKAALHVPDTRAWEVCGLDHPFINGIDLSPPSGLNGGPLARVIERTSNVIIANGNLDMAVPSLGTRLVLQNLTWHGEQGFSTPSSNWSEVWIPKAEEMIQESIAATGIMGKWVSERGLTFVEVDGAGHSIGEWQPSVAYKMLEVLLGRRETLSVMKPFTTQEWYGEWNTGQ